MDDINQQNADGAAEDTGAEQPAAAADDGVKNLKAEFGRKLANQDAILAETNRKLEAILQSVQEGMRQPTPAAPQKPLKDLVYEDADQFAAIVEKRASQAAEQIIERKVQLSQATQNAVSEVMNVYPEFSQPGSEAAQVALQKSSALPKHLQGTPEGIKIVMMETAAELGLVPAKARQQRASSADDFSLSGASSSGTRAPRKDPAKDIPAETLEFARLLGRDVSDPKVLEGLKSASQRKIWNQYK